MISLKKYIRNSESAQQFEYMMLDRLRTDCNYFLIHPVEKHLWAGSIDEQIKEMKRLWNLLKVKPEWLTMEQIDEYKREMEEVFYNRKNFTSSCKSFKPSIKANDYEELERPAQEYDSAATSINSTKLPAIYKLVNFQPGKLYLDFGGGKFDSGIYYVKDLGATLLVYDPYNRSDEHNKEVLRILRENGGADATLNSNVLNVIKEPEARLGVLKNIKKLTKPGGDVYFTVYEGTGRGNEGPTKAGYQLNRKTADYLEEVQSVFPDAKRKGKLIHATNSGSVSSSRLIKSNCKITSTANNSTGG